MWSKMVKMVDLLVGVFYHDKKDTFAHLPTPLNFQFFDLILSSLRICPKEIVKGTCKHYVW